MRTVPQGLGFGESVRWHGERVWLCHWRAGDVLRGTAHAFDGPATGRVFAVAAPAGPTWT